MIKERLRGIKKFASKYAMPIFTAALSLETLISPACGFNPYENLRVLGRSSEQNSGSYGNAEKAASLRLQLQDLASRSNNIGKAEAKDMFDLVQALHKEAYNLPPNNIVFFGVTPEDEKSMGVTQSKKAPEGITSFLVGYRTNSKDVAVSRIAVSLFLGDPQLVDPALTRGEAILGLELHEVVHAEGLIGQVSSPTRIGLQDFSSRYTRGFRWVGVEGLEGNINEVGQLIDESNTQLLAEYMWDPSNSDNLFKRMYDSDIYRGASLAAENIEGAEIFRRIYSKLCIGIPEVRSLHYRANPLALLQLIDRVSAAHGVQLTEPPSETIFKASIGRGHDGWDLTKLRELEGKLF